MNLEGCNLRRSRNLAKNIFVFKSSVARTLAWGYSLAFLATILLHVKLLQRIYKEYNLSTVPVVPGSSGLGGANAPLHPLYYLATDPKCNFL
jgi:hypothetical protein